MLCNKVRDPSHVAIRKTEHTEEEFDPCSVDLHGVSVTKYDERSQDLTNAEVLNAGREVVFWVAGLQLLSDIFYRRLCETQRTLDWI